MDQVTIKKAFRFGGSGAHHLLKIVALHSMLSGGLKGQIAA